MSILTGFIFVLIFLMTITIHEFSHGLVAYFFGDTTAQKMGRLTLNPFRHIDPLWTILLPFVLIMVGLPAIGMARPVPVNFANLRHPKRDMIWVAIAGPIANFFLASVMAALYRNIHWDIFLLGVYFNLGLAIFNMLPIPPLDGSRILTGILPLRWAYEYAKLEKFGFIAILILVWLRLPLRIIFPTLNFFCQILRIPPVT